jgi:chromate transporter
VNDDTDNTRIEPVVMPPAPQEQLTLPAIFLLFLRIGSTSFGMTMLENLRQYAIRHRLVSEQEVHEGLALVQLYPGPIMFALVTFIGYRRRGTAGAFSAAVGFTLPATLIMLAVAWAYTQFGDLPSLKRLSLGLSALVVGIMAHITFDFMRKNLSGPVPVMLAAAAFAAALTHVDPIIVIFVALAIGAVTLRTETSVKPISPMEPAMRRLVAPLVVTSVVLSGALVAAYMDTTLSELTVAFMKIGATAFGNAATILPVMESVVVGQHGWLAPDEFNLAIALGNLTPGPVLNSATFVGYRVAGLVGGLLATIAVFAPSFVMTLLMAELYEKVRNYSVMRAAIQGVMAAFVGLLAAITFIMAKPIIGDTSAMMAAVVTVLALVARAPVILIFAAGTPIWLIFAK